MLALDFEYRDNRSKDGIILLCYQYNDEPVQRVDLRVNKNIMFLYEAYKDEVWVAHNIQAEIFCLKTLGVPVENIKWIDTMCEVAMLVCSHEIFKRNSGFVGLKPVTEFFKLGHKYFKNSESIIYTILEQEVYSSEDWDLIEDYCSEDVRVLALLLGKILDSHKTYLTNVTLQSMVDRAEYTRKLALLNYKSKGLPINAFNVRLIDDSIDIIKKSLAKEVNSEYGIDIYVEDKTGKVVFKKAKFSELIWDKLKLTNYPKSAKTNFATSAKDELHPYVKRIPELRLLYETIKVFNTVKKSKNIPLGDRIIGDRYIRPESVPYRQKTSRTSPLPSKGFIMNQSPWQRVAFLQTDEDNIIIECDYKSQEIAIAACLSGDELLLNAYKADDVYMELAIIGGAAPKGATKVTHPQERALYKVLQLSLQYGLGLKALGTRLHEDSRQPDNTFSMTITHCQKQASYLMNWHKTTFKVFWDWVAISYRTFENKMYSTLSDGWVLFRNQWTKATSAKNFPVQGGGAVMIRKAVCLSYDNDLPFICSLHDSQYFLSNRKDLEEDLVKIRYVMEQASLDTIGFKCKLDINIYDLENQYTNTKADKVIKTIKEIIPLQ